MASCRIFMIFAIVAVFVPPILATEHMVGDKTGWTLGFNYETWAQGKAFHVGDTLVFKYTPGAHNVLSVNGTGFEDCKAADDIVPLTTGNDVVTLSTPGKKWYICSVPGHCESGNQKLFITVLPQLSSPASSPFPGPTDTSPSGAAGNIASTYYGLIAAIGGIFGMIMF
ncbi:hypothetical protein NC652_030767 [Populus alba x Populus x berolinensis]|uniref:Phytocyanin domain-containing protein n=1 Tax=Populus tomentosa TaxID=118781 RepID=A0A8X7YJ24_POPTO|nr:hypothetical protein POTOM_043875 [Populus tomentosa]KAJ6883630.1 hypothetical protein NC652_030767 [Populus alba x Populus x berolinensis]